MNRALAALALILLLAACNRPAPVEPATGAATTPAATPEVAEAPSAAETPSASETETETELETSAATASPAASTQASPGPRPLAIEQGHPNGSILRVTGSTVEPTSITVQVEVINGLSREIRLAYAGNTVRLDDDAGNTYEFIPPGDNPDLQIRGRGTLTGELVFYGVLDEEATALRLQTSASESGPLDAVDVEAESADVYLLVRFSVDIPLED